MVKTFIQIQLTIKLMNLKKDKQYIVEYNNEILGICKIDLNEKHKIINTFNVGQYLKEN